MPPPSLFLRISVLINVLLCGAISLWFSWSLREDATNRPTLDVVSNHLTSEASTDAPSNAPIQLADEGGAAERQDEVFNRFNPVANSAILAERLRMSVTECKINLPSSEEEVRQCMAENPSWGIARLNMYYDLEIFLREYLSSKYENGTKLNGLSFGAEFRLAEKFEQMNMTVTTYPPVDVHMTPFPSDTYDIIATDQMLEHVAFPHLAVYEMRRVLKPGGILIVTTCSYNPLHRVPYDFWRFNLDGMLALSLPFSAVHKCGAWGTSEAVNTRSKFGMGSGQENEFGKDPKNYLTNSPLHPFTIWMVVEK